jgi:allantoin racemase
LRILVINPNSTAAMTHSVASAARAAAAPGTEIVATNPTDTPPAIQGPEDGEACLPGLFRVFDREMASSAYDAVIIACFDDTGVPALKRRARVPVIGIGEASYHAAALAAPTFSVVTTLAISVPVLEANIRAMGFGAACAKVRASGVAVLALESDKDASRASVAAEAARAIAEDGCGAIVLGCAGMADLAAELAARFRLPVIDGVAASVMLSEAVHRLSKLQ